MSALVVDLTDTTQTRHFVWNHERSQAAIVLASGGTKQEAADAASVERSTVYDWLKHPDFCAEIDRLSLMVNVASRAERLRITMQIVKSKFKDGIPQSDKDLLEWLKFAQSETDGVKIDLSKLAALAETETPVAHRGSDRLPPAAEAEVSNDNADRS